MKPSLERLRSALLAVLTDQNEKIEGILAVTATMHFFSRLAAEPAQATVKEISARHDFELIEKLVRRLGNALPAGFGVAAQ